MSVYLPRYATHLVCGHANRRRRVVVHRAALSIRAPCIRRNKLRITYLGIRRLVHLKRSLVSSHKSDSGRRASGGLETVGAAANALGARPPYGSRPTRQGDERRRAGYAHHTTRARGPSWRDSRAVTSHNFPDTSASPRMRVSPSGCRALHGQPFITRGEKKTRASSQGPNGQSWHLGDLILLEF